MIDYLGTRDDQSVFNRNHKFRRNRRSKRKFAGNRFVTAKRDPVEREEAIAEQNIAMTVDEGQDEMVGRPLQAILYKFYLYCFPSILCLGSVVTCLHLGQIPTL